MLTHFVPPIAPLALLASLALVASAAAQQARPSGAAKPSTRPAAAPAQRQAATPPAGGEGQPSLLGQYGDWGAYTGASGGRKVCFALAKPASSQTKPANRPHTTAYLFVSTRPAENVRNEISVMMDFSFKPGMDASVEVGTAKFAMLAQNDGAWVKNAAEEARLLEAMRKGGDVVVKGTSSKGTEVTDRYSLKGLSQALDRVTQECR